MVERYDAEATGLDALLPPGLRLVVIGSTSFWNADSPDLCRAVAAELAAVPGLVALTGGMDGVGRTFGRAFAAARAAAGLPEHLFHLLPRGDGPCDSGVTLAAGADYYERREILGRVGHAYLVIEGGPGTEHEAAVAAARGVPVVPVGRTGGHAGDLYPRLGCPAGLSAADWSLLGDAAAPVPVVAAAAGRLVRAALG